MAGFYPFFPMSMCPLISIAQALQELKYDDHSKSLRYILAKTPKLFFALHSIANDLHYLVMCPGMPPQKNLPPAKPSHGGSFKTTSSVNVSRPGRPPQFHYTRTEIVRRPNKPKERVTCSQPVMLQAAPLQPTSPAIRCRSPPTPNYYYQQPEEVEDYSPIAQTTRDPQEVQQGVMEFAEYSKDLLYRKGLRSFVQMMENMDSSDIEALAYEFFEGRNATI